MSTFAEARAVADAAAARVDQALRDVQHAMRDATPEPTVSYDARAGWPPTVTPGRPRTTPEVDAARAELDRAVLEYGRAVVAETIVHEQAVARGEGPPPLGMRGH